MVRAGARPLPDSAFGGAPQMVSIEAARLTRKPKPSDGEENMTNPPDDERNVAYHEAGHAVAACLLRIPFKKVSILPDDDSLGRLIHTQMEPPKRPFRLPKAIREEADPESRAFMEKAYRQSWEADNSVEINPDRPDIRDWLERRIMCAYAGEIASRLMTGHEDRDGPRADYAAVMNLSRVAAPGDEETYYLAYLRERTKNLLSREDRRAALRALADALLERREISGRTARRIVQQAIGDWVDTARAQQGPQSTATSGAQPGRLPTE